MSEKISLDSSGSLKYKLLIPPIIKIESVFSETIFMLSIEFDNSSD